MTNPAAVHGNFTIERRYPVAPAKVFAACADPAIKKSWYAESHTHELEAFESDFRVGGAERLAYRFGPDTPFPGVELTNEGVFQDIVEGRRIIISSRMAIAGRPISVALETIEIAEADGGTALTCTFQGVFFEGSDGPVMREQGWSDLLDRLGRFLAD
ncbi:SRPBCC domain-containing protein [Sphingomonas yunnanensis]|uniref:SRPBCC domain-containing protein n=1 Tax=Sphingomonas yunnanensis TaxID=310400 RepID=UPI001CA6F3FD|nr:SRPBCC domain-containing protein [Sphingomonas yunnanensis]MBY9064899.1 SRPBCC domain-containing protein [Sphingomonas yunnanensis]